LHEFEIAHRDVKLENILITSIDNEGLNLTVKLADFGLSRHYTKKRKLKDKVGSITYMSPEVIKGKSHDGKVDVWSVCIVIYTLLSGEMPFGGSKQSIIAK